VIFPFKASSWKSCTPCTTGLTFIYRQILNVDQRPQKARWPEHIIPNHLLSKKKVATHPTEKVMRNVSTEVRLPHHSSMISANLRSEHNVAPALQQAIQL
jgi:hypothetical protein